MSQTRRLIRQTMTIARRDFIATVFTPIFLLFGLCQALNKATFRLSVLFFHVC